MSINIATQWDCFVNFLVNFFLLSNRECVGYRLCLGWKIPKTFLVILGHLGLTEMLWFCGTHLNGFACLIAMRSKGFLWEANTKKWLQCSLLFHSLNCLSILTEFAWHSKTVCYKFSHIWNEAWPISTSKRITILHSIAKQWSLFQLEFLDKICALEAPKEWKKNYLDVRRCFIRLHNSFSK